jgi:hypothetical protein
LVGKSRAATSTRPPACSRRIIPHCRAQYGQWVATLRSGAAEGAGAARVAPPAMPESVPSASFAAGSPMFPACKEPLTRLDDHRVSRPGYNPWAERENVKWSSQRTYGTYGRLAAVVKTTVYLSEDVKAALGREAARANTTEADLIRTAVARLLGLGTRPQPRFGQYEGASLTVEEMDETLAQGFGER